MFHTIAAEVRDGTIQPLEPLQLPEGARLLVTILPEDESQFWLQASESSLAKIWANDEDDVYAQLVKK